MQRLSVKLRGIVPAAALAVACAGIAPAQTDSVPKKPEALRTGFFDPAPSFSRKRFTTVLITEGALYGATMAGLYSLWYKDYPTSAFHFFNDNGEWLQMDKAGHLMSSYYIGRIGMGLMRWTGAEKKKTLRLGAAIGFYYLTTVEILDGFSAQWGASAGDLLANAAGTALLAGQELAWGEQRITPKVSFHRTGLARHRPDVLGDGLQEEMLKDYNGQTYWLCFHLRSLFIRKPDSRFPAWLGIALGYGAEGMTGGNYNVPVYDGTGTELTFERRRQYYLSLDIDLGRIRTGSGALNTFLGTFGFIKLPAPAIQFDRVEGVKVKGMYF